MKILTAAAVFAVVGGAAHAQLGTGTANTFADNANNGDSTLAPSTPGEGVTAQFNDPSNSDPGIRPPNNGVRFLNAQNTGGSFDSWAAVRWDLTALYDSINADVAATPGATGFEVTSVDLVLTQAPFGFSAATDFDIYYVTDDALPIDPQTQAGNYASSGGANIDFSLFSGPESFITTAFYDDAGGVDTIAIGVADVLADLDNTGDNALTLAWESAFGGNAAYRGSSPFQQPDAPELVVSYDIVPTPGAAALFGIAGLMGARRRR